MNKKESYWFAHDCNARSDAKIIAMMQQYGMEGYGRWWVLLERLRKEQNYKYNISTKFAYNVLAQELCCSNEEAKSFVQQCIEEYELLQTDGTCIWSTGLNARMEHLDKKRAIMSERGRKGAAVTNAKRAKEQQKKLVDKGIKQTTKQSLASSVGAVVISMDGKEMSAAKEQLLEQLKQKALADERRFVYPYCASGLKKEELIAWLAAFNKHLSFIGDVVKTEKDYRTHFAAWFKYRDVVNEQPENYSPIPKNLAVPKVIPVAKFMKTPEQLAEERARKSILKKQG